MILPFVLLLATIAVFPLVPGVAHWWEHNLHKFYVAGGLAVVTLLYYLIFHELRIEGHFPTRHSILPDPSGLERRHSRHGAGQRDAGRVRAVHRAAVQPVHDQRRHSHRGRPAGPLR